MTNNQIEPSRRSRGPGRPTNREERRSQIVEGLLRVMSKQGYANATVAAIGEAANLTPGLIHHHFESKQQILIQLVETLQQRLELRIESRLERAGPEPEERLFATLDAHVALGSDADPGAVAAWVVIAAEAVRDPEVATLYRQALASGVSRLRRLMAACLVERGRPVSGARRMAAGLMAAIEGAFQVSAAAPGLLPRGFAAPALRRMALGMLAMEKSR
jgi:TetR/AcrR family transcriptional repressor of bet genes